MLFWLPVSLNRHGTLSLVELMQIPASNYHPFRSGFKSHFKSCTHTHTPALLAMKTNSGLVCLVKNGISGGFSSPSHLRQPCILVCFQLHPFCQEIPNSISISKLFGHHMMSRSHFDFTTTGY